jgi:acetyl esterase/lipase
MGHVQTLEYNGGNGKPLLFDWYTPETPGPHPVVVFWPGGGWISGDRSMYADEVHHWTSQGYAVATPEYRLAPLYTFPAAIDDVNAFFWHLAQNAEEMNIDPRRLVSFGNSAGGHLSLMAALSPGSIVAAAVAICPITDIRETDGNDFAIAMSFVEQFMGGLPHEKPDDYAAASPVTLLDNLQCPLLLMHGKQDEIVPVEQSRAFFKASIDDGRLVTLLELEGEGHSFTFEAWLKIRQEATSFLRRVLDHAVAR